MYPEMTAIIATLIIGPLAFYLFSHVLYRDSKLQKFPINITDGLGDILFLPLLNAAIFGSYFNSGIVLKESHIIISLLSGGLTCCAYYLYSYWVADYTDWSKPVKHKPNLGGWYHLIFVFLQSAVTVYGITNFYMYISLWLPLGGYAMTIIYQLYKQGYV